MAKERLQQVGFAGLIGAVAGATLTAHRGRAATAVGEGWMGMEEPWHVVVCASG